jgi:hypothetical protein
MRNKLPILLALVLATVAAVPLLRSLPWRQFVTAAGPTTVPPPAAIPAENGDSPAASGSRISPLPPGEGQEVRAAGTGSVTTELAASAQSAKLKPQTLVEYAVLTIENQQHISAQISEEGELFAHPLAGVGRYYELRQGPISLIHLDMTVQIDSVTTSLVQVCNGTTFWTYRKLPNAESLWKIDVDKAITALDQAAGRMPPNALLTCPGLGGLGRLMRGINAQFLFTTADSDAVEGVPAWKLVGEWKPQVLARLLPDQNEAAAKGRPYDIRSLPGHLPDGIAVYLRQSDYFPLRIDYCRNSSKSPQRQLLSLKFSDVSFRGPIDSSKFIFMPGSLEYSDRTDEFLRSLGQ